MVGRHPVLRRQDPQALAADGSAARGGSAGRGAPSCPSPAAAQVWMAVGVIWTPVVPEGALPRVLILTPNSR